MSESKASAEEQGEHQSDSVFDFMYHDARRVGSFLAQFDDAGHLQQLKQSETLTKGLKRGWKVSVGGGMGDFGTGEVSAERGPGEGGSEASERVYDPYWTNARTLLDYLTEHEMIQREIWKARIGQFVLIKGSLVVLDVAMLKSAWEKPAIRKRMMDESIQTATAEMNRQQRRQQKAISQNKPRDDVQFLIDLLTILPHSLQAQLVGDTFRVWCSLGADSLVGLSSDLVLKHGTYVPGEWHMLAVLDAAPEAEPQSDDLGKLSAFEEAVAGVAGSLVGTLTARLSPITRRILGRPHGAHGVTPLLIFREVSG